MVNSINSVTMNTDTSIANVNMVDNSIISITYNNTNIINNTIVNNSYDIIISNHVSVVNIIIYTHNNINSNGNVTSINIIT